MSNTFHDRVMQVLGDALEVEPARRPAFLDQACGLDPALRAEVERLLLGQGKAADAIPTAHGAEALYASLLPPPRVGPYKIERPLGEGGMGVVFLAMQERPVRRPVALKLIRPGTHSRDVVARFEAERQALAMMDHTNIARVFDAGTTDDGRPYFVMELVRGVPITHFCDRERLPIPDRLRLFIDVCRAVHHAHQKGVIHRDIKPNNVLVSVHDDEHEPVPKVIDFGIAKALDEPLTDKTLYTANTTLVGTPEYMSPEQADLGGGAADVDTRSDVYSLGVLLYELLCGATPFDGRELRSKPFSEMQRIIREVDPPRPNQRFDAVETRDALAERRGSDARRLAGTLRGELDWIVCKCLEKDRGRRYDSAAALAQDLEAYLRGEPVQAGPVSQTYRLRKLVRRHRSLVAGAAAAVLALLVGLTLALLALGEARHQQRLAERSAEEAHREARRAQSVSDFLERTISSADPYLGAGDPRISQVFDRALRELDAGQLGKDPQDEAVLRTVIGRISQRIDRFREGAAQLEKAVVYYRHADPPDERELARTINLYASALSNVGEYQRAAEVRAEAIELAKRLGDEALAEQVELGRITSLLSERRFADAIAPLEQLIAKRRGHDPGSRDMPDALASPLEALASALLQVGRADDAIAAAREAFELRGGNRADGTLPEDLAVVESVAVLAQALGAAGRDEEAVAELERALSAVQRRGRPNLGVLTMLREILAGRYARVGRRERAIELYGQVVEARSEFDGPAHPRVAHALGQLGAECFRAGRLREGKEHLERAWEIVRQHPDMPASTRADIASVLAALSGPDDRPSVQELSELALAAYRAESQPRTIYASTLMNYWLLLYSRGELGAATEVAEELMRIAPQVYAPDSGELAQSKSILSRMLLRTGGDAARAERLAREATATYEQARPDPLRAAIARSIVGEALVRQGKRDEAAPLIESALTFVETSPGATEMIRQDLRARRQLLQDAATASQPASSPAETP